MPDDITPWLTQGGGFGLALAAVWAILRGLLIPARTHDAIVTNRDEQIATWKAAYEAEVKRGDEQAGHLKELLDVAHLTVDMVKAIPRPGARDPIT